MRTGEGKTFIPTLAAVLNGLTGRGAHVVTVNDYLARRDAQWMGPAYHFLGLSVGRHHPRHVVPVRARLPDHRRAPGQPPPGDPPRGLRRGHHLRHQQRVRVRLPARQHGRPARRAGAAGALVRDRRRGRQHPDRRGADPADHLRPGRGVGGPVLHLRAARPQAQGAARGRRGGRRLLPRPQGQGRQPDRGGHRQDREAARHREPVRRGPAARPPLRLGAQGPRALQARPRLHRRGPARSSSSTSSPVARCRAAAGARACTRRSRRRRACASSASPGRWRRSRSRTTSASTTSWPA